MVVRTRLSHHTDSHVVAENVKTKDSGNLQKQTKSKKKRSKCCTCLLFTAPLFCFMYIFTIISFMNCKWIQNQLIYVHKVKIPYFVNLSNPAEFGLQQATNFYLQHVNKCRIGIWYVPRGKYSTVTYNENEKNALLNDGSPIILYLHGNTGTRGTYSRVGLYKYLSVEKDYHVITFDYRGFGDSDCYPSETNLMEDGLLVWNWIRTHTTKSPIYIWGHSLGSSAAVYLTVQLQSLDMNPAGILLDAPFTNVVDAAYNHPFGLPFVPLGKRIYQGYMHERHPSDERIHHITCPIMIMHGHSDIIIPFHVGKKLYDIALTTRDPRQITFVDCGQSTHKYNYLSQELRNALDKFIKQ